MSRPVLPALLLVLLAGAAAADGDRAAGQALAERLCASCHAIQGPGPGPIEAAPLFSGFARRWPLEDLAEALAEGILVGHGKSRMPQFVLEPRQIDDLLAYLRYVQR